LSSSLEKWLHPKQQLISEQSSFKEIIWNTVQYCDCMDAERGLPYLRRLVSTKQIPPFDLVLTDPPFNLNYEGYTDKMDYHTHKLVKHLYQDNLSEEKYLNWINSWFHELQQISIRQIIFIGRQNIKYWTDKLKDIGVWIKRDSQGMGSTFWFVKHEFFITAGKWSNKVRLPMSIYECNLYSNKLSELKHTCPRPLQLYIDILRDSKAKSVLDPFLGSGTTAAASKVLGINWYGYEKELKYKSDIDYRINRAKPELKLKQKVL